MCVASVVVFQTKANNWLKKFTLKKNWFNCCSKTQIFQISGQFITFQVLPIHDSRLCLNFYVVLSEHDVILKRVLDVDLTIFKNITKPHYLHYVCSCGLIFHGI